MAVFNGMFPIRPGKEDTARAWIGELSGSRKDGFDALQRRSEIERETLTLVPTPMGAFLLVWFDGNIEKAFAEVATGDDEFSVWHRGQLSDVTGIDLNAPAEGPSPELLLDWHA